MGSSLDKRNQQARWHAIGRALIDRLRGPEVYEHSAARIALAAVRELSGGATVENIAN